MTKSQTDLHWDERAVVERDSNAVNIADVSQRELETKFILDNLESGCRALEVGCGNGFLTDLLRERAAFVDAFDFSENMIDQARKLRGEAKCRFFHDNVLAPSETQAPYDAIVCVRVLINLRDLAEQMVAIRNMHQLLRPQGRLILVEGYSDGFEALNSLRQDCGLKSLKPAAINFYSKYADILAATNDLFRVQAEMHTGMFDILTRVVYPLLMGEENATGHSEFHSKVLPLAKILSPDDLKPYARLHGLVLERI